MRGKYDAARRDVKTNEKNKIENKKIREIKIIESKIHVELKKDKD
jgi:hypothetical protein